MAKRVHTVQESDLRMLGSLARTIQRVLPVTQADIDAAAALGQGWVVEKVFEVALPLDNCRGGTQLIIRENSITPGKYITRVMFVRGPGGQEVTVAGVPPLVLPDALEEDIVSLKAFGGTEQRNLPLGYTQLEYIQSTGTQYIDTGVLPTTDTGLKVVYEYTDTGTGAIAGIYQGTSPRTDTLFISTTTGVLGSKLFCAHRGATSDNSPFPVAVINTKYTGEINYLNSGYMGFGNYVSFAVGSNTPYNHSIPLFARYGVAADNYAISNSKIYSAVFTEGNTISHNFIPCKDPNGVVGMFDTVSQTFFTNAGTGDFIAGPQAYIPSEYTLLQYVANTSGTYIDLGVAFNDADSQLIVTADAVNNINYIVSARENNTMQGIAGSSTTFKAYIDPVSLTSSTTKTAGHKYQFTFTANNGDATFKTEDLTASTSDTQTAVYTVSQTQPTAHLGAFGNSYGNRTDADAKIYSIKYSVGGAPVLDLVPARKGAQIGLYNKVNGTFLTATQGSLLAGMDVPSTNPVPTPDNPIDIWCNNGVLKAKHQSGLPLGYTRLEYIQSTGTQYIDSGRKATQNTEISVTFKIDSVTQSVNRLVGNYAETSRAFTINPAPGGTSRFGTGMSTEIGNLPAGDTLYTISNGPNGLIFNGTTVETWGAQNFTTDGDVALLASTNSTSTVPSNLTNGLAGKTYNIIWKENNVTVMNLLPARRNSDNAIGMYDTANNQFYENAGTGTFTAGPTVSDPVEIYADGTQETIGIRTKNQFDYANFYDNYVVPSTSTVGRVAIKLSPNTQYTVSTNTQDSTNAAQVWVVSGSNTGFAPQTPTNGVLIDTPRTVTSDNNGYICIGIRVDDGGGSYTPLTEQDFIDGTVWVQIEEGSTATDYVPYFDGGTATCEDLLSVGDYTDEQEVISGAVTRKVGVKVLGGTENWVRIQEGSSYYYFSTNITGRKYATGQFIPLCSHFKQASNTGSSALSSNYIIGCSGTSTAVWFRYDGITSQSDFKQWLADQYNAGTPVIVVYPLATPTTETVTGQPMSTTEGDNTAEITQASMDGLELEVTYIAGVVLTVEEVEDAQLSPDVEVTIQ